MESFYTPLVFFIFLFQWLPAAEYFQSVVFYLFVLLDIVRPYSGCICRTRSTTMQGCVKNYFEVAR